MSRSERLLSRLCLAVMLLLFIPAAFYGSEGGFAPRNPLVSLPLPPADSNPFALGREGNALAQSYLVEV